MTRRIRVKLDFTLVLDHDVEGIDDDWASIPWATTVVAALDADGRLGVVAVEKATRTLSVVQEKPKRVRKPRPRVSEDIRLEPSPVEEVAKKMAAEFARRGMYVGQKR